MPPKPWAGKKGSFLALSSFWWWPATRGLHMQHSESACTVTWPPPCVYLLLCPLFPSYRDSSHIELRAPHVPVWPHLNQIHLQCSCFQINSHSQILGPSSSIYPIWRDAVQPITGSWWQWVSLLYLHFWTITDQGLFLWGGSLG